MVDLFRFLEAAKRKKEEKELNRIVDSVETADQISEPRTEKPGKAHQKGDVKSQPKVVEFVS